MPTRNWIDCSRCGKKALVRVGAAYCSPECQERRKRSPTPDRKRGASKSKNRPPKSDSAKKMVEDARL